MDLTKEQLVQIIYEELEAALEEAYKTKGKCVYKKDTGKKVGCTDGDVEDYLQALYANVEDVKQENIEPELDEERKKAGTESSKESSLRDWFGRKGAKGKKSGWVDCNAPDGKGGYKACGRSKGEKRKKYPACRPTPGACKERGKGKSWGKKGKKK